MPKNPLYEDKVLFVANIPNDCDEQELRQFFDSTEQQVKAKEAGQNTKLYYE